MTDEATERRRGGVRVGSERYDIVSARLRPGRDARVIDVSAGGALIESSHRMLPGAHVELQLQRAGRPPDAFRAVVVRCSVACVRSNAVSYRGAVAFERPIPWCSPGEPAGYVVPIAERRANAACGQTLPAGPSEKAGASAWQGVL